MYEMGIFDLVKFIQNWKNQNISNYRKLFFKGEISKKITLPYIIEKNCPKNINHCETIEDLGGRTRCTEKLEMGDVCYEIVPKVESIISLEVVLEREKLGECIPNYRDPKYTSVFPFDGNSLAQRVKLWDSQTPNGNAPLYEASTLREHFKDLL